MNRFYFRHDGEIVLNDRKIIRSLLKAAEDYENGEIIEVRDLLAEIVYAIDEFSREGV